MSLAALEDRLHAGDADDDFGARHLVEHELARIQALPPDDDFTVDTSVAGGDPCDALGATTADLLGSIATDLAHQAVDPSVDQ